jgi:hypothetical protein
LGEAVAVSGNVKNFQITGNYIHDNDNTGVALIGNGLSRESRLVRVRQQGQDGFVGKNKLERNAARIKQLPRGDYGAAGIYADGAKDITIAYNECARNDIGIMAGTEAGTRTVKISSFG